MRTTGKFYIINECNDNIKAAFLTSLPIIWNKDGKFCVIPKAVVQNVIDINTDYSNSSNKITSPIINLWWCDGIPISNLAGRALVGE